MRHEQWERRLNDYLLSVGTTPHAYGEHDCLLHCGYAAEAVTGKDHTKKHRGKYKSQATAVRHLKRLGFDTPEAYLDSLFDAVPIGFAQRGDLVLTPANDENGWNLPGVCVGDFAFCAATKGLVAEPRSRWLKAWRV